LLADHHLAFTKCQTISLPVNNYFGYRVLRGHLIPYGIHHHMMDCLSLPCCVFLYLCRGGFSLPRKLLVPVRVKLPLRIYGYGCEYRYITVLPLRVELVKTSLRWFSLVVEPSPGFRPRSLAADCPLLHPCCFLTCGDCCVIYFVSVYGRLTASCGS
jgi:hypothetical protein